LFVVHQQHVDVLGMKQTLHEVCSRNCRWHGGPLRPPTPYNRSAQHSRRFQEHVYLQLCVWLASPGGPCPRR
jgi:hypothetical protein